MDSASIRMGNSTRLIIIDIVFVCFLYLVPIISHVASFPLYLCDPMRLSVLGSYLMLRNKTNSLFLAVTLPLFSYFVTGHPIFIKNIIISIELTINLVLLFSMLNRMRNVFAAVILSIGISKLLYYAIKYVLIYINLLQTAIIDTAIWVQVIVTFVFAGVFHYFYNVAHE